VGAELRRATRRKVQQPVLMVREDGSIIGECMMLDVSSSGARLRLNENMQAPSEFTLLLSRFNSAMRRRCTIAWRDEQSLGIRFLPA